MEEYLNKLEFNNNITDMYTILNEDLTASIIKSIERSGDISSFTKSQFQTLVKTNGQKLFEDALKNTNSLSSARKQELSLLFNDMITEDMKQYVDLYEHAGKEFKLTEDQLKIVENGIKRTNDEFANFSSTIANSTNTTYVNAMNNAYIQTASGGMAFDKVFTNTINTLAKSGVTLMGKSIEAYTRQGLKYSLRQNMRETNQEIDDYLGTDGVQINISMNCRPDHIPINGKMFSNKDWKKYKHLLDDYGCQHYETGVFMEFTPNRYTNSEINTANNRTVEFNGKKIPYYEATQHQRALERQIRYAKRELAIFEKSGVASEQQLLTAKNKVTHYQTANREYVKQTGLTRDYDREKIAK